METKPIGEFKITAIFDKENGGHYKHFGINPVSAVLYGDKPEDIVEVNIRISDDQSTPVNYNSMIADYWGWYDYKDKKFSLIYPKRFLLEMCFPYGIAASERAGQGKAYRLELSNNI
jgi:hypothetical protein